MRGRFIYQTRCKEAGEKERRWNETGKMVICGTYVMTFLRYKYRFKVGGPFMGMQTQAMQTGKGHMSSTDNASL